MANEDVRVLIGEIDGYEYDNPKEHKLLADQVPFDNSINGFLSVWTQDAIEEARTLQEFQYAVDEIESTTSSLTFIQKLRLTTTSLVGGLYFLTYNFEYKVDANNKKASFQVEVDDITRILEIQSNENKYGYKPGGGFIPITLTPGVHTIDIDYAKVTSAATIRRARIALWRP